VIRFVQPEAFLLGLLLIAVLRRRFVSGRAVTVLRAVLLLLLLGLLAGPYVEGRTSGRDLVLVFDRSFSAPETALDTVQELAEQAAAQAQPGDRIGLVTFGRDAVVERAPEEDYQCAPPAKPVDRNGTDLARALDAALALIPPDRQGSILLISDGEGTGRDPGPVARHALRNGVRIDAVPLRRVGLFDLAVEEVAVPGEVAAGEPFQISVWVRSDRAVEAPLTVLRDGREIASGRRRFRRGLNRVRFRDIVPDQGIHKYEVRLLPEDDRVPENDRARAALRVAGPFRVLCVTPGGRSDRLTRSLEAAGVRVRVAAPGTAPLSDGALDGFRAVVLENVPFADLPGGADGALTRYVRDLGGGLLMTGGRASFGPGGYHRTGIEEVLPVSMEVRQEQRKFSLAMAIALDRSGSMAAPAGPGRTKMDLANLGACAAVELLGGQDSVAVVAVDSSPHVVVPLTAAADTSGICGMIRRIESMGGGIYTNTAIRAAARELTGAKQAVKHIVIFADAADAEEPGDYKTLVPALVKAGVTISVIGLGRGTDSDAAFLQDLARLGNGRCFFASDAGDLPRVFAQETIQVVRSAVVEEPTAVSVLPGILAVGALRGATFPQVGGYSIAYLEDGAQRGLTTRDDMAAPLLSFWQHGLGRSAAYLGIADGELSGGVATWNGYADFFAPLVRWVAGTEASSDVFAQVTRRGHEAVLSVEVDPEETDLLSGIEAHVLDPEGKSESLLLVRTADTRLEARVPLASEGIYRPILRLADGSFLRLPAVTLPYSPEYEPRMDPAEGEETLRRITRIAEGRLEPPADELMAGSRSSRGVRPLSRHLAWLAVAVLLLEITVRRLHVGFPTKAAAAVGALVGKIPLKPSLKWRRKTRPDAAPEEPEAPAATPPDEPPEPAPPDDISSVLDRARKRGRRR
jgi:von Willebrand factor type A domain